MKVEMVMAAVMLVFFREVLRLREPLIKEYALNCKGLHITFLN